MRDGKEEGWGSIRIRMGKEEYIGLNYCGERGKGRG